MTRIFRQLARRGAAAAVLLALAAGTPLLLGGVVGWPGPRHIPTWQQIGHTLTSPPHTQALLTLAVALGWALWAVFITSLATDLLWLARHGLHTPHSRRRLGRLSFALLATVIAGTVHTSTAHAATAQPAAVATAAVTAAGHSPTVAVAGASPQLPAGWLVSTGRWQPVQDPDTQPRLVHHVSDGDWMWHIAGRYLHEEDRYGEIAALNPHLADRYTTFPDHIQPGDQLLLPAGAVDTGPRPHATGTATEHGDETAPAPDLDPDPEPDPTPDLEPEPRPEPPPGAEPGSGPRPPTTPPEPEPGTGPGGTTPTAAPTPPDLLPIPGLDPDRVVPHPDTPTAKPHPSGPPPAAGTPEQTQPNSPGDGHTETPPAATATGHPDAAADDPAGTQVADNSWISWAVAAGIVAAAALVWRQRRRRYTPRHLDLDHTGTTGEPVAEPAVVGRIRRLVRAHTHHDHDHDHDRDDDDLDGWPAALAAEEPYPETTTGWHTPPHPQPQRGSGPVPEPAHPRPAPAPASSPGPAPSADHTVVPLAQPLPEGGTALTGPGAQAAARGAVIAALATGAPDDPDNAAEVVAPADLLATLFDTDPTHLTGWPRLRITADLPTALAYVEARLLATARLLDDYDTTDIAGLRAAAPAEQPVPPLLLVATTPPAGARMRTRHALGLANGQHITAVLLGHWPDGPTVHVDHDGTCHPTGTAAGLPRGVPTRLSVLAPTPARQLLHTLREAHTGQPTTEPHTGAAAGQTHDITPARPPAHNDEKTRNGGGTPAPSPPAGPPAGITAAATQTTAAQTTAAETTAAAAAVPAEAVPAQAVPAQAVPAVVAVSGVGAPRLPVATARVLGEPLIVNARTDERVLRKASLHLLVYLAVHSDGADPDQILEDLWPESRRRLAATNLHTAASNLRHHLAAAAGADPDHATAYVHKEKGRYRLAADLLDIDLWHLRDGCNRARRSREADQRIRALADACRAYHGELAHGYDHEWITAHREGARGLALDAHTSLARLLSDTDPHHAAQLLLHAVDIDPMAETVYQQAMRAHHRIGDPDTIRSLLRQLTQHLEQIGAEPTEETLDLARQLRHGPQPASDSAPPTRMARPTAGPRTSG